MHYRHKKIHITDDDDILKLENVVINWKEQPIFGDNCCMMCDLLTETAYHKAELYFSSQMPYLESKSPKSFHSFCDCFK